MDSREVILRVKGVSKSFGGSKVLDDVGIDVGRNQIVGIVGENGAGKSTLFNIISGIIRPDSGRIELHGKEIRPADYHEASLLGISRVFQEQALIPNIPVFENLLLSHEALFTRAGQLLDRGRMIKTAERIVAAAGIDINVRRRTSDYDFSKRQSIEIGSYCSTSRPRRCSGRRRRRSSGSSCACASTARLCSSRTGCPRSWRSATSSTCSRTVAWWPRSIRTRPTSRICTA
jgi:ABC-type sugar transport system ATPase subunit